MIVSVVPEPSETDRSTTQMFESAFVPHPGVSKSGAFVNVRAPDPELILNKL